jgi:UDPglucose--hexose-1-phosphate uridylyltransferase
MSALDFAQHPHHRLNLLTNEWVLVSPHRTSRPWQGQMENATPVDVPPYDPACYMCPGNTRANGMQNPPYTSTFAFTNDFAALMTGTPDAAVNIGGLFRARGEPGECRVLCFSPRHDLTIARMSVDEITQVVHLWAEERRALAARPDIAYVQIFENRGAMMGASNPHPHGQIWASASLPNEVVKEQAAQQAHLARAGHDLLGDYLELELREGTRVVCVNDGFVALVPFWAVWPFETIIVPRRRVAAITQFDEDERRALAELLKRLLTRYDNLFNVSFPYSMGFHEAPAHVDAHTHPEWRWHGHVYPPLLRSATVRKFMVGYELLATPQRDIPPEQAAERLRALPEVHQ